MHTRITRYTLRPEATPLVIELIREKWVPILEQQPGFRSIEVVELDKEEIVTIIHFDTAAGSLAALERARQWILEEVSDLINEPSSMVLGDVVLRHANTKI